jgi:hypothetical protein
MNHVLAASYIGKHLLVGMTYLDHNEQLLEQKQFHGDIVRINDHEGIVIRLSDSGNEFKLPPDIESLTPAPEGEYRLRATGEVVLNPDLTTTWILTKPKPELTATDDDSLDGDIEQSVGPEQGRLAP